MVLRCFFLLRHNALNTQQTVHNRSTYSFVLREKRRKKNENHSTDVRSHPPVRVNVRERKVVFNLTGVSWGFNEKWTETRGSLRRAVFFIVHDARTPHLGTYYNRRRTRRDAVRLSPRIPV